jgi:hypothetical protein
MGTLDRRVANLKAAAGGGPGTHCVPIGSERVEADVDHVLSQLGQQPRSSDLVVILTRFADPQAPAELSSVQPAVGPFRSYQWRA